MPYFLSYLLTVPIFQADVENFIQSLNAPEIIVVLSDDQPFEWGFFVEALDNLQ